MKLDLKSVKGAIGDLLAGKESLDIVFGMFRRMFGGAAGKPASIPSGGSAGGTEIVGENAAQEGELYGLLTWLRTLWIDDKTRAIDYRPKSTEAHIFPKVVSALKPGATNRFMKTVAVEIVTVKVRKTTGFADVKDPKNPSSVKKTPIYSEYEERCNVKGEQIANALTWLVSTGQGTEDERVQAVAEALENLSILSNPEDKATAAYEATKDRFRKFAVRVTKLYGENDTVLHQSTAKYLLRDFKIGEGIDARPAYDVLMESPKAVEWMGLIEAATSPDEMREHQEGFQQWLQEKVLEIRKRKGPLRNRERQRNLDDRTDEKRHARNMRLIYIASSIATALVLLIGMVQGALR